MALQSRRTLSEMYPDIHDMRLIAPRRLRGTYSTGYLHEIINALNATLLAFNNQTCSRRRRVPAAEERQAQRAMRDGAAERETEQWSARGSAHAVRIISPKMLNPSLMTFPGVVSPPSSPSYFLNAHALSSEIPLECKGSSIARMNGWLDGWMGWDGCVLKSN